MKFVRNALFLILVALLGYVVFADKAMLWAEFKKRLLDTPSKSLNFDGPSGMGHIMPSDRNVPKDPKADYNEQDRQQLDSILDEADR